MNNRERKGWGLDETKIAPYDNAGHLMMDTSVQYTIFSASLYIEFSTQNILTKVCQSSQYFHFPEHFRSIGLNRITFSLSVKEQEM